MKKVSVCVPTYNQEKEIKKCLESILCQKECDFEIIIADDASTDKTREVCEEYQAIYPHIIRIINRPVNVGVVKNTRDCLLAATGKYIAICEGDDYWIDEYKLAKQVKILEDKAVFSMVHTLWLDLHEPEGTIEPTTWNKNLLQQCIHVYGQELALKILQEQYIGIRFSSILFRNDDFKKILERFPDIFSEYFSSVDICFFYALANLGKLYPLEEYTTMYRIHDGSVSVNSDSRKVANYSLGILFSKCYFLRELTGKQSEIQNLIRNKIGPLLYYNIRFKDEDNFDRLLKLIRMYDYSLSFSHRICLYGIKHSMLKKSVYVLIRIKRGIILGLKMIKK